MLGAFASAAAFQGIGGLPFPASACAGWVAIKVQIATIQAGPAAKRSRIRVPVLEALFAVAISIVTPST